MGIKAVLLDMDGTLIDNDRNRFGAEYTELVYRRFPQEIPFDKFKEAIYISFEAMTQNNGQKTNEEVFQETFFPLINFPIPEGIKIFDHVHKYDFSSLKREDEVKPETYGVVKKIFDMRYKVVIATNPIFPLDVMYERLRWANIEKLPFDLVTSYETSTYAKPNPLYYREILDKIGEKPENCLMVGDEHMDMVAALIGIKTMFIKSASSDLNERTPKPNYRGKLADIINILQGGHDGTFRANP
ncbi:MAG: HAD family hydrolase [Clostridiales bacterium]|mgnify:CR=1 FL=1|nr:HAD family hydrolase [Clostridiales bacterium]